MQKQLILLDREVDEYENLHLLLKSCRARCEHLERQIDKYEEIKERNKPRRKIFRNGFWHCPTCGYVVDNRIPSQYYCDRCGQKLCK
jgi:rubrerythrin|nr:MAG TPA: DNA-directed RNA polymerase [Caudoviricetes sp.]